MKYCILQYHLGEVQCVYGPYDTKEEAEEYIEELKLLPYAWHRAFFAVQMREGVSSGNNLGED